MPARAVSTLATSGWSLPTARCNRRRERRHSVSARSSRWRWWWSVARSCRRQAVAMGSVDMAECSGTETHARCCAAASEGSKRGGTLLAGCRRRGERARELAGAVLLTDHSFGVVVASHGAGLDAGPDFQPGCPPPPGRSPHLRLVVLHADAAGLHIGLHPGPPSISR